MQLDIHSAVKDLMFAFNGVAGIHDRLDVLGVKPMTVLEVGAGSGKLSLHYALRGVSVVTSDIDMDMVRYEFFLGMAAQALLQAAGRKELLRFEATLGDMHKIECPDKAFDLVFNEGSVEHFPLAEQVQMLGEMARVSRDWVVFLVPDAVHPESQRIAREVVHHYVGMPDHEKPLSTDEVRVLVAAVPRLRLVALEACLERWHLVVCKVQEVGV